LQRETEGERKKKGRKNAVMWHFAGYFIYELRKRAAVFLVP
jgi:hypothetical protein